ncbi:MAG: hypothetical protein LUD38_05250, partial [Parabacteroides sp.]|nr:hypothetical protein [Parabacteroides sp.]
TTRLTKNQSINDTPRDISHENGDRIFKSLQNYGFGLHIIFFFYVSSDGIGKLKIFPKYSFLKAAVLYPSKKEVNLGEVTYKVNPLKKPDYCLEFSIR